MVTALNKREDFPLLKNQTLDAVKYDSIITSLAQLCIVYYRILLLVNDARANSWKSVIKIS